MTTPTKRCRDCQTCFPETRANFPPQNGESLIGTKCRECLKVYRRKIYKKHAKKKEREENYFSADWMGTDFGIYY